MDYFNVNKQYAFGIDLSVYNGSADGKRRPDFDRIAAHQPRVAFAALRAGAEVLLCKPVDELVLLARLRSLLRARESEAQLCLGEDTCRDFGLADPRIAVAGLNPHAGEAGHLGREEIDVIEPVLHTLRAAGMDLVGPLPADTAFLPQKLRSVDAVVAMYHDQALIPIKTLAFDSGVNATLGLPFVRTSPDHGTAFGIAGKGTASAASLIAAIKLAAEMSTRRARTVVT